MSSCDLEEFKRNLRSVLLSVVGGVQLNSLEHDYRKFVCRSLRRDMNQLGFATLPAMLESMPDVAK